MGKILNSKLILLWQKLSKEEQRALKRFLQSPFFTLRQDVYRLYEALRRVSIWKKQVDNRAVNEQRLQMKSFTKATLFTGTYPDEAYDDLRLRACMNDLQELIERFLLIRSQEQNPVSRQLELARLYQERQLDKHFKFAHRKLQNRLDLAPWKDADHYQQRLDGQVQYLLYESKKRRTGELQLQQVSDSIDQVFLIRKLRYACTQLSHQAVYSTNYDFGLLPHIIDQIPSSSYYSTPAVAIYFHCYKFLSETQGDEHYRVFSQLFFKEANRFSANERKGLYQLALNFCIRHHNKGDSEYTREAWRLYRFALDQGLLLEQQQFSRFAFNNIVGIAIKLEELNWAEQFIKQYSGFIAEEFRTSTIALNSARLAFARKAFPAVLPFLQEVQRQDLLNNLIARVLLIKVFYETEALTALEAQLDSLEQLLRRKDVSPFHQRNFGSFIRLLRRRIDLAPYDEEERQLLLRAINQSPELSEKDWLIEIVSRAERKNTIN